MKRIAMGALALMLTTAMGTAHAANSDGFIRPETRIKGCITIVDKVRDGTISPTDGSNRTRKSLKTSDLN